MSKTVATTSTDDCGCGKGDECQWDDFMRGVDDPWGQRADFERSINERIDAADYGSSQDQPS